MLAANLLTHHVSTGIPTQCSPTYIRGGENYLVWPPSYQVTPYMLVITNLQYLNNIALSAFPGLHKIRNNWVVRGSASGKEDQGSVKKG